MKKIILLLITVFVSLNAQATLLKLQLNQQDYQIGDVVIADVVVSNIEEDFGFQKLLASFEFTMSWDNALLHYSTTSFGSLLDVDPYLASEQDAKDTEDSVRVSEISYAFSDDLFTAQNGQNSFTLATMEFNITGSGISSLNFSDVILGDDFGGDFTQVNALNSTINVVHNDPIDVPEPNMLLLMLIGFLALYRNAKS